jgi:hypothetical protein
MVIGYSLKKDDIYDFRRGRSNNSSIKFAYVLKNDNLNEILESQREFFNNNKLWDKR